MAHYSAHCQYLPTVLVYCTNTRIEFISTFPQFRLITRDNRRRLYVIPIPSLYAQHRAEFTRSLCNRAFISTVSQSTRLFHRSWVHNPAITSAITINGGLILWWLPNLATSETYCAYVDYEVSTVYAVRVCASLSILVLIRVLISKPTPVLGSSNSAD